MKPRNEQLNWLRSVKGLEFPIAGKFNPVACDQQYCGTVWDNFTGRDEWQYLFYQGHRGEYRKDGTFSGWLNFAAMVEETDPRFPHWRDVYRYVGNPLELGRKAAT